MRCEIEFLQELVRIPSVNPAFGTQPLAEQGEGRLALHLAGILGQAGLAVHTVEVLPGRFNVEAVLPGRGRNGICLSAHLDTVASVGMTVPAFAARLEGNRVFGRGSADTKGSVAAMVCALLQEAAVGVTRAGPPVLLLLTCDEEAGFRGARHFASRPATYGFGLAGVVIGEPTGNRLVTAHKGVYRCDLQTSGISAHASMPERGVNAIYRMATAVSRLADLARTLPLTHPHPRLGGATLSVGTIQGGTAVNTVPDLCTATLDRRVLPGETEEQIRAELARALADVDGATLGAPYLSVPGYALELHHPWAEQLRQCWGMDAGVTVPYCTDAAILGAAGLPCAVLGPGDGSAAHTADESVSTVQLGEAMRLYRELIARPLPNND